MGAKQSYIRTRIQDTKFFQFSVDDPGDEILKNLGKCPIFQWGKLKRHDKENV